MRNFKETIKKLIPFLKPYMLPFLGAVVFIVAAAVINAITPRTEGLIITQLTEDVLAMNKGLENAGINFPYIIKILSLLGVLYVISAVSTYVASYLLTNAIQNTIKDLRDAVQSKIRKLPISYFDQNSFGDVLSRITNDIDSILKYIDVSINRMQEVREKFKQQTESVADNFQHCLFLIEMNPEHQLLTKELQDFFDEELHKTLKWSLRLNPQITSLRITVVLA